MDIHGLEQKAHELRRQVLDMCVAAETGHVTSCFSCAEIMAVLYYGDCMRYRAADEHWDERDRFILSKGQASPILYAVLADCGFFPKSELGRFCRSDGMFGVHLQHDVPGVEITSGSLGHGLGIAAGIAYQAKLSRQSYHTYVLLGDGECHEGSVWEAALFIAQHRLSNLTAIIDRNQFCVTDRVDNIVSLSPLEEKWRGFGWDVCTVDGHSVEELLKAITPVSENVRPRMIIADTVKGKGISFLENKALWHGLAPIGDEATQAKEELR